MSKILFVTWPGGGNQPPAIGLAQQLRRAGHDTLFAGSLDQAERFDSLGLGFVPLGRAQAAAESFDPTDLLGWLARNVWACPQHVADVADVIASYRPDLIVVDCLMGGVL